ncbi:MAG: UDP-N-acetylmuramoyl-L-alanyl-D-glutamate--2,6-diaminopimelate ligase [Prolixibacteraceae bacterium]|nr:UDP-N-acetylmuramoyl-L-alanyl-D-glutamate--2,6-diaminopimelate ligase [Prolixibacteraceae bacterium]
MISLNEILSKLKSPRIVGSIKKDVVGLAFDSRLVKSGYLFAAIKGTRSDGHDYIPVAEENGAGVILCEKLPDEIHPDITYIEIADSEKNLGFIASAFYGNPSSKLKVVGVTGTNGKTSIATLLYRLFNKLGYKSGLISTIKYFTGEKEWPATHTTPDAIQIQNLFSKMVTEGCEYCFMEVSSHAIVQNRIAGIEFAGGIFTNITLDHLDYHKTFAEYIKAKKGFFDQLPENSFAVINADDKNGKIMVQNSSARVVTYSTRAVADYKCKVLETHFDGMLLNLDNAEIWTKFIGKFNAYNLLAVYATALCLGESREEVLTCLSTLDSVRGRFETIRSLDGKLAIVDYAHTPDALRNVLETITGIRKGDEQVITVIGAGGDRDKSKRPLMAKEAISASDKVILTSDNPRTEIPEDIIADMEKGIDPSQVQKVLSIVNRKEAIKTALMLAKSGDIILVAGKGHENYQEIKGVKHHFDDKEEIEKIFGLI